MLPRITIVTPSYNQGNFIEETINSVLSQGYPDLEYIVIDGGSSDGTVDILKRYSDRIAYWVSEPDEGQSDAINKGLARATGEVCAYLNSDDLYLPGALQRVGEMFRDPACLWVCSPILGGEKLETASTWEARLQPYTRFVTGMSFGQQGVFWRRSLVEPPAFRKDLHYVMDHEFFCRLLRRHGQPRIVPEPTAWFRLHPAAKTATIAHRLPIEANEMVGRITAEVSPAEARQIYREMLIKATKEELAQLLEKKSPSLSSRMADAVRGLTLLTQCPRRFRDRIILGAVRRLFWNVLFSG
jgi:glycosyltransferase involved in cell wall biosynthesis